MFPVDFGQSHFRYNGRMVEIGILFGEELLPNLERRVDAEFTDGHRSFKPI